MDLSANMIWNNELGLWLVDVPFDQTRFGCPAQQNIIYIYLGSTIMFVLGGGGGESPVLTQRLMAMLGRSCTRGSQGS